MFPIFKWHTLTTYLVMVEGTQAPKRHHKSYWDAKDEAIRLCNDTGKPTYLLQVLKKYDTEMTELTYKNEI